MVTEKTIRVSRYETIIATLVGVSALFVSGYTAHVQRQQVRAAVWPILEYGTSNEPDIRFTLDNKGVGPAIIRHVVVTIDGSRYTIGSKLCKKITGEAKPLFTESDMKNHVLSAGESMNILIPHDTDNTSLTSQKRGPMWEKLDPARARVGIEICYCSTLGDCWKLRADGTNRVTTETRQCPTTSAITFQQ